ncbi:MAG: biotin--[Clostridia bacterium]|nr:biotin--[acetyl-CoA-carboxylase] ligase [Clostridia bacterium]
MFSKDRITSLLTHSLPEIELHETIDSTNLRCKTLAEAHAPEGTLVIAGQQTAGRGRLGRTFFSPAGTGLYMSLLLRPAIPPEEALSITTCAAVCVSEAIEAVSGRKTGIKWVNDIYLDGRKVCGILTEAAFTPDGSALQYAVLGIGVNVASPEGDFPPELTSIAASVFGDPGEDMRPQLAAEIVNRFFGCYPRLREKEFWQAYRDRLFLRGQPVQILWGSEKGSGICLDVDRDFRLLVQREDGSVQAVSTGEVSVKPV